MKLYENEAALCTAFAERARSLGWKIFPETGKFDLLLVATDKVMTTNARVGDQIGVEAKLHCNVEVLAQAMSREWGMQGPNFHAVLVPFSTPEFASVARRLNLLVFEASTQRRKERTPAVDHLLGFLSQTSRVYYDEPIWHPDVEIWTPPGVKSPKRITPWKVSAVQMCLYILEKGYALLTDFREADIAMDRWKRYDWIIPTGERVNRHMKYVLNPNPLVSPPHLSYPEIAEQLKKDREGAAKLPKKRLGR